MKYDHKLEVLLEKEFKKHSANSIVSDDTGNNYLVFGKYEITQTPDGFMVSDWHSALHCFSAKRIALSWCIADKYQRYNLSNNIVTAELEKCINSAKYLQIRGFHNETARTSGS